jgi:hypothetical protein
MTSVNTVVVFRVFSSYITHTYNHHTPPTNLVGYSAPKQHAKSRNTFKTSVSAHNNAVDSFRFNKHLLSD